MTSFEDVFGVSIEPTPGRWAGKFPERRFGVANQVFEESEDEDEERSDKDAERK